MRFVPHRNTSFQYSIDKIDDDYDSGYSSDSSTDSCGSGVVTKPQATTGLDDILQDLELGERYARVCEAAEIPSRGIPIRHPGDDFRRSMERWAHAEQQRASKERWASDQRAAELDRFSAAYGALARQFEDHTNSELETQDAEVQAIVAGIVAERKRKEEEERKRREEEERKRLEEEARRAEEARRLKEEEEKEKKAAEKKRADEEAKAKAEAARKKAAEDAAAKKAAEEAAAAAEEERKARQGSSIHLDSVVLKEFLKYKKDIADIKAGVVEPLMAQKELKQATNKIRRKINPRFGQLNNSASKLQEVTNAVVQSVSEAHGLHELSFKYILNFVAKELIKQAEVEVIVSPSHAVPLAGLVVNLLQTFPQLEYFLMARFYKKCPYLIGFTCPIDTEEGRRRMGWRKPNGKWEDEAKYNERVGGIATLYLVVSRVDVHGATPISLAKSWLFLSRTVNTKHELLADIHYILVANWWEACAFEFLQAYRGQAHKLVQLAVSEWLRLAENRKFSGYVRLRILAEDWAATGNVPRYKRMEP